MGLLPKHLLDWQDYFTSVSAKAQFHFLKEPSPMNLLEGANVLQKFQYDQSQDLLLVSNWQPFCEVCLKGSCAINDALLRQVPIIFFIEYTSKPPRPPHGCCNINSSLLVAIAIGRYIELGATIAKANPFHWKDSNMLKDEAYAQGKRELRFMIWRIYQAQWNPSLRSTLQSAIHGISTKANNKRTIG